MTGDQPTWPAYQRFPVRRLGDGPRETLGTTIQLPGRAAEHPDRDRLSGALRPRPRKIGDSLSRSKPGGTMDP